MINLEIVEFIKRQLQAGESQEKIRNDLLSNGWTIADINEAMASIVPQSLPTVGQTSLVKKSSRITPIIISLVVLALLGGGIYFYLKNKKLTQPDETTEDTQVLPNELSSNGSASTDTSSVKEEGNKLQSHTITTIPSNLNTKVSSYLEERIIFNGDGDEVMYLARNSNSTNADFIMMKNENSLGEFLSVNTFEPSVDGHSINYAALKKIDKGGEMFINGISASYGGPAYGTNVVFSDDGKHYAYVTFFQEGKMGLFYDNELFYEGGTPVPVINGKASTSSTISFSPSMVMNQTGNALAVISQVGLKKQAVLVNPMTKQARLDTPYDDILSSVVFSPDLKHYSYRAQDKGMEFIVVDGKSQTSFNKSGVAWAPVFSLDSKKISYAVTTKNTQAIDISTGTSTTYFTEDFLTKTDMEATPEKLANLGTGKSAPIFDNAGKNYANIAIDLTASENKGELILYLEVNGKKLDRPFGFISTPKFDSTGKFIMFGAREGDKLQWVVYEIVNGELVER